MVGEMVRMLYLPATMNWDWSPLGEEEMKKYRDLCPVNEYRVYGLSFDLPGVSKGLAAKCPTVLLASSGDANGRVFYMANLHRPDPRDPRGNAVDQMPFGFVFDNESPMLSGVLLQHGDWRDRTVYPPSSTWNDIVNGNYQAYANLSLFPPASAGSIFDLSGSSQRAAFSTLIIELSSKAKERVAAQLSGTTAPVRTDANFKGGYG